MYDWTLTWTATSIDATAVANASSATSAAISNDGKLATEVAITIAYGATATTGVVVSILRDVDGTNYEVAADLPWRFSLPFTVSTTHRRTITVPGDIARFKVMVSNDSGASVTADVDYRQAVVTTA